MNLEWKEETRRPVLVTPVFTVGERACRSPDGVTKTFTVLDAPDWAIVIPVLEADGPGGRRFVMVRQWRHGAGELSLEFPGGVFEPGETPRQAALRELREETGYTPARFTALGAFNPNPAIMSNHVHFFLAEDLSRPGAQELDEDEYVNVETVPCEDAVRGMGTAPYIHALMGTAMALYLARAGGSPGGGRNPAGAGFASRPTGTRRA